MLFVASDCNRSYINIVTSNCLYDVLRCCGSGQCGHKQPMFRSIDMFNSLNDYDATISVSLVYLPINGVKFSVFEIDNFLQS